MGKGDNIFVSREREPGALRPRQTEEIWSSDRIVDLVMAGDGNVAASPGQKARRPRFAKFTTYSAGEMWQREARL